MSDGQLRTRSRVQTVGLVAGAALFGVLLVIGPPAGVEPLAWRCAAVAALMVIWWATEALPLGATSVLPVLLFPALGLADLETTAKAYGSSMLFLLLGASLVALAVERSGLHRRLAYGVLQLARGEPRRIVLALMIASAFISMWVSNLATALMMLPVALGLAACAERDETPERDRAHFLYCLLLGVGYAATIGGMATIVGTPTNGMVAGIVQSRTGVEVSFATWLAFGLPIACLLVPLAWILLTRFVFPFQLGGGMQLRETMLATLRPTAGMSAAEKRVALVFIGVAVAWTTGPLWRELPGLASVSDAGLAIAAAVLLFALPSGEPRGGALLAADDLRRAPWEVLLLLGGSLALSAAMDSSGLSRTLIGGLGNLSGVPLALLVISIVGLVIVWTEVATNASAAATAAPALVAIGVAAGIEPALLLLPAALAASCGYALPIGTPANTAVYAAGKIPLGRFVRAGAAMDVLAFIVLVMVSLVIMPGLFARA